MNFRIKKMGEAIGNGDFKGFTIDRSETQEEINTQIDVQAEEFQKFETSKELQEDGDQFYGFEGALHRWGGGGRSSS